MVFGGNSPFFGTQGPNRVPGETRSLRYDSQKDNMANVLFPGEQQATRQEVKSGHRNVTSVNHPFLPGQGNDAPTTGRRAVRGPQDTNDLLVGPSEDAPAQRNVGMSTLRSRYAERSESVLGSPEAAPVAGRETRRHDSMGTVLFGGAPAEPTNVMAGKRRGPINYADYQVRLPASAQPASGGEQQQVHDPMRYGLAAPADRAAALPPRPPAPSFAGAPGPASRGAAPRDALDGFMEADAGQGQGSASSQAEARMAALRLKWQAVGAAVAAMPRDSQGMLVDIAPVADALSKQGLKLSVAGFSELLARCDVEPSGFPSFAAFLECVFKEEDDERGRHDHDALPPARPPSLPASRPPSQPQHHDQFEGQAARSQCNSRELYQGVGGGGPHFHMPDYTTSNGTGGFGLPGHPVGKGTGAGAFGGGAGRGGMQHMGWQDEDAGDVGAPPGWTDQRQPSRGPTPRSHAPPKPPQQPPAQRTPASGGGGGGWLAGPIGSGVQHEARAAAAGAGGGGGGGGATPGRQLSSATEAALLRFAQRGAPSAQPPYAPPAHEAAAAAARRAVEQQQQQQPPQQQQQQPPQQQQQQPQDDGVQMRRVPGSRAPLESKSAVWATSGSAYGRYGNVLPPDALNGHVGMHSKHAAFTRAEPKREANSGFAF